MKLNAGKIAGSVGNFLTDASGAVAYGAHKGLGKVGMNISLDTAQKLGVGIIGGATAGATIGAVTNLDEGISPTVGGSLRGAGLGAVGGAGAGAIAAAIAKGIR